MPKLINLEEKKHIYIGKKFGQLTILDLFISKIKEFNRYFVYAHCKCDCGNECDVKLNNLTRNTSSTKSCGCLTKKACIQNSKNSKKGKNNLNEFICLDPYTVIVNPLGSNPNGYVFYVDSITWLWLNRFRWYINSMGYMATYINKGHFIYHKLILNSPLGYEIDHINRDKCNNMYSNLRVVPHYLNMRNTEVKNKLGYKGINKINENSFCVQTKIPNSGGKRRTAVVHSLQEAINLYKKWDDEFFENAILDTPKLVLPNGSLNPYFRFDWFHPSYNEIWKELGFIK
jgi:hypothetical protein